MKILFGMMVSYGTQIAFIATLDQILRGLGYKDSNETTALTILCAMLIGIVATPVFSTIIKKTKKYKLVTILSKKLIIKLRCSWMLCFFRTRYICLC